MLGQTKVSICSFPFYAFPGVSTWKKNSLLIVSESQEEQPDKDEPDRTCEACLDDLPASSYRRIKLAPDCDHNCSTCELCLRQAIDAQLSDEEADWGTLHCPTCRSVLLPETVRKYSPEGILAESVRPRASRR